MRYMITNAGVRAASRGAYWRIAWTLLRRLRFTALSIGHDLGSMSGGHHPEGGSRRRSPQPATTTRTQRPTAVKISVRLAGVRTAENSAMKGTAPQPTAPVTNPTLMPRASGYHLATVEEQVA